MIDLIRKGREGALIEEEDVVIPKSIQKEENIKEEEEKEEITTRFKLRLSREEEKRLRFRSWDYKKKIPNTNVNFEDFGPRWGRGLSLAFEVLPFEYKNQVYQVMKTIGVFNQKTEKGLRPVLKELSDVAKKHGDILFEGYWKLLVNWENLGGYLEIPEMSLFKPDIREWVTGVMEHKMINPETMALDEDHFLETLSEGMMDFYNQGPNLKGGIKKAMTIKEYAADPSIWMSSGSSMSNFVEHNKAIYALDVKTGKYKKAKKTKSRTGLALGPDEVEEILRTKEPKRLAQYNVAIPKAEPGKVRAVVNSALEMFLRMDYVSVFLETAMKGHPMTTLYYSEEQMFDMWERMGNEAKDLNGIKIPLDQSHFDWQQNMKMIEAFCKVTENYIRISMDPGEVKDDLLWVMDSICQGMYKLQGVVVIDDEVIKVEKGVLSGWRWTALIDTVFNLGEMHCARKMIGTIAPNLPSGVTDLIGQGDDDKVMCSSAGYAAALTIAYDIMNFEINPGKFFVDNIRDEYLRQVSEPGLVCGYLVRGINTILWRNPGSSDPPAGLLRAGDQLKAWNKLINRGGNESRILQLLLRDISKGNGLTRDEVQHLLRTPVTVGGLGYLLNEPSEVWLSFKPGEVIYNTKIKTAGLNGLRSELKVWKERYGREFTNDERSEAVLDRLDVSSFAEREVVEGKVTETPFKRMSNMTWDKNFLSVQYDGPPLSARVREEYPRILGKYVLQKELEDKNGFEYVQDKWIDPTMSEFSKRIYARGGRRIWTDWILDKLPFKTPIVPGWREEAVSLCYRRVISRFWYRLTKKASYNYDDVIAIALLAEKVVFDNMNSLPVRSGG